MKTPVLQVVQKNTSGGFVDFFFLIKNNVG